MSHPINRRSFLQLSTLVGASGVAGAAPELTASEPEPAAAVAAERLGTPEAGKNIALNRPQLRDLSPAKWIWYPSERTLANTFVLFRRALNLASKPARATGWIVADSRYQLDVNGKRIQWGPAPSDPRWAEADPMDLTEVLNTGDNVLGATVLHYGHGDGTWPFGRPGFLFWLSLEYPDGTQQIIVSDDAWQAHLCRAWRPGQYRRWFLRSLQEEFDARRYPFGWSASTFVADASWPKAMVLKGSPNQPALCADYMVYTSLISSGPSYSELRPRSIPLIKELLIPVKQLAESMWIDWHRPAEEFFETRGPDCFSVDRKPCAQQTEEGRWQVQLQPNRGAVLTFELPEQVVGFPYFTISAPAGTVIDLLTQEGHEVGAAALLYTTMNYSWARFVCREGNNSFECFDYESLRWLQLHIQGQGTVTVQSAGVRRRLFPWKHEPVVRTSDAALQQLFNANVNTLYNSAIDTFVDGHGRERQQYAGDCAHQVSTAILLFGDARLSARYLTTWSQGPTKQGYFLDAWPAIDRLERIIQRQMDLSPWGPLIDVAVQFVITAWDYYLFTGDLEPLKEPYPRVLRFADYLISLINRDGDGLLPVTDLDIPHVFMDFDAYPPDAQRNKQCAFNLYVAAMFDRALAPMCITFGDDEKARTVRKIAAAVHESAVRRFWSHERKVFVDNLPWINEDGGPALSDLALSMALLFDQCPQGETQEVIRLLATRPKEMGTSYPTTAVWRLWGLGKGGRADVILDELRNRWATMPSVSLNNTIQELWQTKPDSWSQWSHAGIGPLSVMQLWVAGLRPLAPGFSHAELQPQLGDLEDFEMLIHTGQGPVHFRTSGKKGRREMVVTIPRGCTCDLLLNEEERVALKSLSRQAPPGYRPYALPSGKSTTVRLKFT